MCFRCVTETGSRGKMAAAVKMLKAHKEEEQQIDSYEGGAVMNEYTSRRGATPFCAGVTHVAAATTASNQIPNLKL